MDYCSSCRRYLNGALVCPGCGAYAPDIAPPEAVSSAVPVAARPAAWETPVSGTRLDLDLRAEASDEARVDEAPLIAPAGAAEDAPPAPQGRAARRRQLARWKKNKRRAAVATAVALVGGGLTVATLDRQSADQPQAATAPPETSLDVADNPAVQHTRQISTPPDAHRSAPTTPPAERPAMATTPRQRYVAAVPRTTPPLTRQDAAAPRPTATLTPHRQAASPAPAPDGTTSDSTGTTANQPSTSTPAATDGTNSGTSPTSPVTATTSPTELCLLVVCLD
jgi:hypothetical protein